eukprot:TRINITY_DN14269_c0_g1_i1.p1 TRINITY_DN14269_c0_g1~~TRINITY_DN14269_c0_g1_i1.p1  ORF type:complete len:322 (+),score=99.35 TRINITY_DN14269_c0_g1_i1:59-1024(+)
MQGTEPTSLVDPTDDSEEALSVPETPPPRRGACAGRCGRVAAAVFLLALAALLGEMWWSRERKACALHDGAADRAWAADPYVARVVVLSDTHGRVSAADYARVPDGDVLLHCGDITRKGGWDEAAAFNAWLAGLPHKIKVVMPGNHDLYDAADPAVHARAKAVVANATHYVHDGALSIDMASLKGSPRPLRIYTNPTTSPLPVTFGKYTAFTASEADQVAAGTWDALRTAPERFDVVATHSPPRGTLDRMWGAGPHAGSAALAAALAELAARGAAPRFHVFGHVHRERGAAGCEGETTYVNAAWEANSGRRAVVIDVPLRQ